MVFETEGRSAGSVIGMDDDGDAQLTEAEANIILFALNAVADGHEIARVMGPDHHFIDLYDGPTEGVAPKSVQVP